MLIRLVIDTSVGWVEDFLELPETTDNVLKITKRKLAGIHKTWRSRTKDMDDHEQIIQTFYDILDEKDIAYREGGLDATLTW